MDWAFNNPGQTGRESSRWDCFLEYGRGWYWTDGVCQSSAHISLSIYQSMLLSSVLPSMYLSIYDLCFYHLFIIHLSIVCVSHLSSTCVTYHLCIYKSINYVLTPMYHLYFYHLCVNQSINYGSSVCISLSSMYVSINHPSIHPSMGWAIRHTEPELREPQEKCLQ